MTYLDVSEEEGDVQEDDEYDGDDQHLLGPPVRDLSHTRREEIVDGLDDDEAVGDRVEHIGEHVDRSKRSNVGRPRSRDAGRDGGGGPAARANRSARRPRRARQPVSRQRSDLPRHVPKHHLEGKKNGCGRPSRGERSKSLCLVSWWRTTRRAHCRRRARASTHTAAARPTTCPPSMRSNPRRRPTRRPRRSSPRSTPLPRRLGDRRGERRGAPPRALDGHPAQGPPRVQHLRHRRVPREELAPSRRPRDRRRPRRGTRRPPRRPPRPWWFRTRRI